MRNNILSTTIITLLFFACSTEKQGNMIVQGTIIGMQKGMLYLQKVQDTILVSVDSTFLNGTSNFRLVDNLESPELYYLTLNQLEVEKIDFFGEKGTVTINTKLEKFHSAAEITGSESHNKLNEFRDMSKQFTGRRLEIIKETFEAQIVKDTATINKLNRELGRLILNKRRYTANFALRNINSEVSPFLVLTELFDSHITLLDTVNNSLADPIKGSKYGVELEKYIKNIKKNGAN
jgi:hypothetical protein|tara:strand:- start:769 stop:1473 length:705 start_codon:yes stop_codon:yes gene_type:complete